MKKLLLTLALFANVADAQLIIAPNEATAARRRVPVYLVDVTDGVTPETGITLTGSECRVSKAGAAAADCTGSYAHIEAGLGYYQFDATEVDTVGSLTVHVVDAAARPFVGFAQVGLAGDVFAPTGTAQASTGLSFTQVKLASTASSTNDIYVNNEIVFTSGTGGGQTRRIIAYNGTTKVATVTPRLTTKADTDTTYVLLAGGVKAAQIQATTN